MREFKNTYNTAQFRKTLTKILTPLQKKYANPIYALKQSWLEIAPDWAKMCVPTSLKDKTLFLKSSVKNNLILQYKEAELVNIAQVIIGTHVEKIKIIY